MITIQVRLTEDEKKDLIRIALQHDATPGELLAAFAADLAGSDRSGGSDERMLADDWLSRQAMRWIDGKLC
jgi:hypothetical protein